MSGLCKTCQKLGCESYGRAFPDASIVSVAAAPLLIAPPERMNWYAIQTRYRAESKVKLQLDRKRIESFLPAIHEVHRWSDRRKQIAIPLFSGYMFVRCTRSKVDRVGVLHIPGVLRFVDFGGVATSVPCKQIEDLQKLLENDISCSLHAFLKVGQRVRIRGGCLNGLEGILEQTDQKKLVISIDCIERSVAVQIEGYELELA